MSDLAATRRGDAVELQFTVPARTSDGVAYRASTVLATVCRAVDTGSCQPVAALSGVLFAAPGTAGAKPATMQDALPAALTAGPPRLLTYRVELSNPAGRTAGFDNAAYAVAGAAPAEVSGLRAAGSRAGVELRWQAEGASGKRTADSGSDVVLRRELLAGNGPAGGGGGQVPGNASPAPGARGGAAPTVGKIGSGPQHSSHSKNPTDSKGSGSKAEGRHPGAAVVWLSTTPLGDPLNPEVSAPAAQAGVNGVGVNGVIDDGAAVGNTYSYAAERQRTVQLGGHTLLLHSGLSAAVEITPQAVYPPPAPADLVGAVFPLVPLDDPASAGTAEPRLAVDLIWTPADDTALPGSRVIGYRVAREVLDANGSVTGARVSLTPTPVSVPAFHDVLPPALAGGTGQRRASRLRYTVSAVDARGLQSPAATTVVNLSEP